MDDYIKREDAIKWLKNLFDDCGNYMPLWHYGEVLPKIIELLEVDVAPVRHAMWIWDEDIDEFICSSCYFPEEHINNYCPNCGAKMDEGEDDAE